MAPDVFISYKSQDYAMANLFRLRLLEAGISCWMAPESIAGGSSYAIEIPRAISESKVFLLLITEKALDSPWIPKELDRAINNGIKIYPIIFDNIVLRNGYDFMLSDIQCHHAGSTLEQTVEQTVEQLRAFLNKGTSNDAELEREVQRRKEAKEAEAERLRKEEEERLRKEEERLRKEEEERLRKEEEERLRKEEEERLRQEEEERLRQEEKERREQEEKERLKEQEERVLQEARRRKEQQEREKKEAFRAAMERQRRAQRGQNADGRYICGYAYEPPRMKGIIIFLWMIAVATGIGAISLILHELGSESLLCLVPCGICVSIAVGLSVKNVVTLPSSYSLYSRYFKGDAVVMDDKKYVACKFSVLVKDVRSITITELKKNALFVRFTFRAKEDTYTVVCESWESAKALEKAIIDLQQNRL